jgi:asparagine synthase (glutamine-hydrolysing)
MPKLTNKDPPWPIGVDVRALSQFLGRSFAVKALAPDAVELDISATSHNQLFYRKSGDLLQIGDDLRLFAGVDDGLDERAVCSLLQFGAVLPPYGLWSDVRRALPGWRIRIGGKPPAVTETAGCDSLGPQIASLRDLSLSQQVSTVVEAIDRQLLALSTKRRLLILFSGGVDSGLLAARAAALGLKDTRLVNYSFGMDDEESAMAERMARHLGLRFERIEDNSAETDVGYLLEHAGALYTTPFFDHSVIPTCALARAVIDRYGGEYLVLDGSGADSDFGVFVEYDSWRRVCSLPSPLLHMGAAIYRQTNAWGHCSFVEHGARIMRRAAQFDFPFAAIAQNPLHGIAYHFDEQTREDVVTSVRRWLAPLGWDDPLFQRPLAELAIACACIETQKDSPIFANSQVEIAYPFLHRDMVQLAAAAAHWEGARSQAKWVLKEALARQVPGELVYRPKGGFVAPITEKLRCAAFCDALEEMISGGSAISRRLERKVLRRILDKARAGNELPAQTAHFAWGVVFADQWLLQVSRAAKDRISTPVAKRNGQTTIEILSGSNWLGGRVF